MDEEAEVEEDYAQPETPIPIILARDEELGLHDDDASADSDSIRPVQHPPPAYGLWRSSVVSAPLLSPLSFLCPLSKADGCILGMTLTDD